MTFEELRQRFRWICDDGTNSEALEVLYPNMDGMLINEAVRSFADCLTLVKYSNAVVYSDTGLVTLPSDTKEVLRIRFCGSDLASVVNAVDMSTSGDGAETSTTKFAIISGTTLQLYTPTPIPAALTIVPVGTTGNTTYGYRVSAVTPLGTSILCAEVTTNAGNATLSSTDYNYMVWGAVPGAIEYNVYRTTGGDTQGLLDTVTTNDYSDKGTSATTVVIDDLIMHLWYKAYPATLVNPTDVPSDIPVEYHPYLVDTYAKAIYMRKLGNYQVYSNLMQEWTFLQKQLKGKLSAAADPTGSGMSSHIWVW
jgi:hypothetical protein